MRLHLAGAHQVDAGEQDPDRVQQRLELVGSPEQLVLGAGKAEVVVGVMPGEAGRREGDHSLVRRARCHDEG